MEPQAAHAFFLTLALMLISARVFGELFSRLGLPAVIGELLAGVVLGPSLLGWVAPSTVVGLLAEIGIILMLFEVGLETDVRQLLVSGVQAFVVAVSGFIWPFALGFAVSRFAFGLTELESLFIGGTLTATSIGITVRVMTDLQRKRSPEAQVVLGASVIDDLLGVILLAVLYEFSTTAAVSVSNAGRALGYILVFFLLAPICAKLLSHSIDRWVRSSRLPGLIPSGIVSLVLMFAWLAHEMGAPELLGGFAAGIALSRRFFVPFGIALAQNAEFAERVEQQMRPIIGLFVPIFFVMVGLSINLRLIDWTSPFIWGLSMSLMAVAVIGKLLGAMFARGPWSMRLAIGIAMIPRGEVGLVFAEMGRVSGLLGNDVYAALILVIAGTTVLSPLLLKFHYRGVDRRRAGGV